MAYLRALGCYLPSRVVDNTEVAKLVEAPPEWIVRCTGIEQRRFAADEETVASLGLGAAEDCLGNAGLKASEIGLLMVARGSSERRFPGPAGALLARPCVRS